jgi:hypothetical protein
MVYGLTFCAFSKTVTCDSSYQALKIILKAMSTPTTPVDLSSISTCGQSKFHETVEHRRKPGVWKLIRAVASPSSRTGIPLDPNEAELLQLLKQNASPYPIIRTSRSIPSPAKKLNAKWNFSDKIFSGKCQVTGCGMNFQGCRVDGWIAL